MDSNALKNTTQESLNIDIPEEIVGEHIFESVLYFQTNTVSKLLTGGSNKKSKINKIKKLVKSENLPGYPNNVAVKTDNYNYIICEFTSKRVIKDSFIRENIKNAVKSDEYTVEHEENYNTGTLKITVKKL